MTSCITLVAVVHPESQLCLQNTVSPCDGTSLIKPQPDVEGLGWRTEVLHTPKQTLCLKLLKSSLHKISGLEYTLKAIVQSLKGFSLLIVSTRKSLVLYVGAAFSNYYFIVSRL